eukprot:3829979-Amphidinium_carterae.1
MMTAILDLPSFQIDRETSTMHSAGRGAMSAGTPTTLWSCRSASCASITCTESLDTIRTSVLDILNQTFPTDIPDAEESPLWEEICYVSDVHATILGSRLRIGAWIGRTSEDCGRMFLNL